MLRVFTRWYRGNRLIFLIVMFIFSTVQSQRKTGYFFSQNLGIAVNPLGLLLDSRLMFRIPLSQDTGILFRTSKFEAGIINEWSPADELVGIGFNYEPIAVFNIRVNGGFYENYRLFCYGYRSLLEKNSPYHDTVVADLPQHTRTGSVVTVAPSLKLKAASVIIADNFACHRFDIFNEDGYYFHIRTMLPHATHDWYMSNDVLLLYEINRRLLAGGNHKLTYVNGTGIREQKLGAMVIFSASGKKVTSYFGLATCGVYLESKYRKHSFYFAALTGMDVALSHHR